MQRPDAYAAADKLTKPVWLVILGVAWLLALVLGITGVAIAAVAAGVYLVDVRPKTAGNPGEVALSARASSLSPRWRLSPCRLAPGSPPRGPTRCPPRRSSTTSSGRTGATCPACACTRPRPAAWRPHSSGTDAQDDEAWAEVLTLAPDADIPGMRLSSCATGISPSSSSPARPAGTSSRGDRWSPTRTMIAGGLQSRRHRRTVLMRPTARESVAALVDHTLLKPEATEADVAALVAEAAELGVFAVCVSPSMVDVGQVAAPDGRPRHRRRRRIPVGQASFGDQGRRRPRLAVAGRRRRDRHGHRRRGRAGRRLRRGGRRYRGGSRCDPRQARS